MESSEFGFHQKFNSRERASTEQREKLKSWIMNLPVTCHDKSINQISNQNLQAQKVLICQNDIDRLTDRQTQCKPKST